jgi:hypothetical protein
MLRSSLEVVSGSAGKTPYFVIGRFSPLWHALVLLYELVDCRERVDRARTCTVHTCLYSKKSAAFYLGSFNTSSQRAQLDGERLCERAEALSSLTPMCDRAAGLVACPPSMIP